MQNPDDIFVLDPSVDPLNPKIVLSRKNNVKANNGGIHFLPKVRKRLKVKSNWMEINKKEDYEFVRASLKTVASYCSQKILKHFPLHPKIGYTLSQKITG